MFWLLIYKESLCVSCLHTRGFPPTSKNIECGVNECVNRCNYAALQWRPIHLASSVPAIACGPTVALTRTVVTEDDRMKSLIWN